MKALLQIVIILLFFIPLPLIAMTGEEASEATRHVQKGYVDSITSLKLEIFSASGKKRTKKILYKQREKSPTVSEASLMIFSPDICSKSMAILTIETENAMTKQWMFLPALRKVRAISVQSRGGSLAGSEFSYEDLAANSFGDYRFSSDAGPITYQGKKVLTYTRYPTDADSYYSKQEVIIDANTFILYKIDFYDQKKELCKTLTLENYHQIGDLLRFQKATMLNHLNKNRSVFYVTRDRINTGLSPDTFERVLLEKKIKQTQCIR